MLEVVATAMEKVAEINEVGFKEKIEAKVIEKDEILNKENPKEMITRNSALEGKNHPETNVAFRRKEVETEEGIREGVFPEFEGVYEVDLPEELYKESDRKHFNHCNEKLKEEIETNLDIREKFSVEQIEQIMEDETPDGYTWHHTEDKGKLQLVDYDTHRLTAHTGGRNIWGGGTESR